MTETASTMPQLGIKAPDFELEDVRSGVKVRCCDLGGPLLVMFICNHCPYVRYVADEIARIGHDYKNQVNIVGIMSNDVDAYPQDSPDRLAAEATARGYTFAYLYDETQDVAKAYRAACTPDFFVFDGDHLLVYRGQLDSARPSNTEAITGQDLRSALDAVLEGRPVANRQQPSLGCNIKWKPGGEPDYV